MVTDVAEIPHEMPEGEADNMILAGLLLFASNWTNPAPGEQATESVALPEPAEAAKLMVKGSTAQVAFGVVGRGANTTEAYAAAIMATILVPIRTYGRNRRGNDTKMVVGYPSHTQI